MQHAQLASSSQQSLCVVFTTGEWQSLRSACATGRACWRSTICPRCVMSCLSTDRPMHSRVMASCRSDMAGDLAAVPHQMVDELEAALRVKFPPGYTPGLRFMSHLWEPLRAHYRCVARPRDRVDVTRQRMQLPAIFNYAALRTAALSWLCSVTCAGSFLDQPWSVRLPYPTRCAVWAAAVLACCVTCVTPPVCDAAAAAAAGRCACTSSLRSWLQCSGC